MSSNNKTIPSVATMRTAISEFEKTTVPFQILLTFLSWFLDKMLTYAQPTHFIFGEVKYNDAYQKSSA